MDPAAASPDPLVTIRRDGNRRVLAATDAAAAGLGLHPGMLLSKAQAMMSNLVVREADPDGDLAFLTRLAGWCLRYAPLAAPDPPDGLWIDVTGSTHLLGGETALLHDLTRRLTQQGLGCRTALADTPALAHAAARFAADPVKRVPPETHFSADPWCNLPIEALRLPPDLAVSLHLLGFDHSGALIAAPRAPLVRRFGPHLGTRLDQALGRVFEPIQPIIPSKAIQVRQSFLEPLLTRDAFSAVIGRLTAAVCRDLEQAGRGARRLDLLFERVDGTVQAVRIGSSRPSRSTRHLARLLDERLEHVDPGLGIDAMHLLVSADDTLHPTQTETRLIETRTQVIDVASLVAPLVDRLANRLGEARIFRCTPVESHIPERSVQKLAPFAPAGLRTWPSELPRPIRLLNPPQPVEVIAMLPDHPPVTFTWRRIRHRVKRADGPERIAGEWWKHESETHAVRDYFRIEDDTGRRFWLFRDANGPWFLHGLF